MSSSSRSTSGNIPLSASQRPMFVSTPSIGNSFPTLPPRSITSLADTRDDPTAPPDAKFESSSPVVGDEDNAYVCGGALAGRLARRSPGLNATERSFVCRRDAFELPADCCRSRAGTAGFGMLVEVVNDGGAGNGPSMVLGPTDSLSTALGGWYTGTTSRLWESGGARSTRTPHSSQYSLPSTLLVPQLSHLIMRSGLRYTPASGSKPHGDYTLEL